MKEFILTTYYNPAKYKNREENYKRFIGEIGHPVLTLETAFGDEPFHLKDSIKLRAKSPLWMKERLLRIGERLLPKAQDWLCFVDADILFENRNWLEDTKKLLKEHKVVQPFKTINRRFKDWTIEDSYNSFGYQFSKGIVSEDFKEEGHPGFAFACRRDSFDLYDKAIAGTGDTLFFKAVTGQFNTKRITNVLSGVRLEHYLAWAKPFFDRIKGSLHYTEGTIDHLYHGSIKHRQYYNRMVDLERLDFNPATDLSTNSQGLLETNRGDLRDWLNGYFKTRKEDDE